MRWFFLLLLGWPGMAATAELKVATWNLEWLSARQEALPADAHPKRPEDIARLRAYAATLDADVVAFQEVDGLEMAAEIFPPARYAIHITADRVVQRVGLAIRRGIAFSPNPDVTGLDLYPTARFPLRSGADVTLLLPGGRLRLLAVHLKTGCRERRLGSSPACQTLQAQLAPLQAWIAAAREPFLLLGDFNRWMDGGDRFWAGLNEAAPLTRATSGHSSPCWGGGGFIDHIIAGGEARAWMAPDSLRVLVYRETGPEWKERLSDHCAVSTRFRIPD